MTTLPNELIELVALLSPLVQGRVYPHCAPERSGCPYLVYRRVSVTGIPVLDGGASSHARTQLQLDLYASSYASALATAQRLRLLLAAWPTPHLINLEQDLYEPDCALHRVLIELAIWHTVYLSPEESA